MLKVETTFANKVIVSGIQEDKLQRFVEFLIKYTWMNSKLPGNARFVKEAENPGLDKLPKTFSIKDSAERAIKRGVLILESLGPVYVGLNARITNVKTGVNPCVKVDIDKFVYERDDRYRDLKKFVTGLVSAWEQGEGKE
jgi:hypothetical protein